MKGVILAGGLGTRLHPVTLVINKHLLPVYDRPMVHHPIRALVTAGVDDLLIVTGEGQVDAFRKVLAHSPPRGVRKLAFAVQQGEGGIADALRQARDFAQGHRLVVALGDNLIEGSLAAAARAFHEQPSGARILLKPVDQPEHFGVAQFDAQGRLLRIVEKPVDPPSRLAVTGFYFYDPDVFDLCDQLQPSPRGELEITDLNNAYLHRGDLTWGALDGWWIDAGSFDSLHRASCLVASADADQPPSPDAA